MSSRGMCSPRSCSITIFLMMIMAGIQLCEAWVLPSPSSPRRSLSTLMWSPSRSNLCSFSSTTMLRASTEENTAEGETKATLEEVVTAAEVNTAKEEEEVETLTNESEDPPKEASVDATESEEAVAETTEAETEAPVPEMTEEEKAIIALKEEITQLEADLKEKRRQVAFYSDRADEFTKTGYARRVAEMENMRRARSMLNSSNKSTAMASTLAQFLPILDQLEDLRAKYGDDEFGAKYNALYGALKSSFTELGVTEFQVQTGDAVDKSRMAVLATEHSKEHASDTVIRPLRAGLELQGNLIRLAECVASLGPPTPGKGFGKEPEQD